MIRKKNNFYTFIFSLVPGAGQMYMGFMKRGLSLMSIFFLIIFSAVWLNIGPLFFIALITWFYSFFDTHNLRSTPDDEFYTLEDNYIIFPDFLEEISHKKLYKQYRNIIAVALIIIGISILWSNLLSIFGNVLSSRMWNILHSIGYYLPQLVIGLAIMLFGFYLIRGKKEELDSEEADYNTENDNILYNTEIHNDNFDENKTNGAKQSINESDDIITNNNTSDDKEL